MQFLSMIDALPNPEIRVASMGVAKRKDAWAPGVLVLVEAKEPQAAAQRDAGKAVVPAWMKLMAREELWGAAARAAVQHLTAAQPALASPTTRGAMAAVVARRQGGASSWHRRSCIHHRHSSVSALPVGHRANRSPRECPPRDRKDHPRLSRRRCPCREAS